MFDEIIKVLKSALEGLQQTIQLLKDILFEIRELHKEIEALKKERPWK